MDDWAAAHHSLMLTSSSSSNNNNDYNSISSSDLTNSITRTFPSANLFLRTLLLPFTLTTGIIEWIGGHGAGVLPLPLHAGDSRPEGEGEGEGAVAGAGSMWIEVEDPKVWGGAAHGIGRGGGGGGGAGGRGRIGEGVEGWRLFMREWENWWTMVRGLVVSGDDDDSSDEGYCETPHSVVNMKVHAAFATAHLISLVARHTLPSQVTNYVDLSCMRCSLASGGGHVVEIVAAGETVAGCL